MNPYISKTTHSFTGHAEIPGDKSISHRSVMFGALAEGRTTVTGLLEGEDVMATAEACRAFGAKIERLDDGSWVIDGQGLGKLKQPTDKLDMGNSGTSTRLLAGLISGHAIKAEMTGDDSLVKRPMQRIITPLTQMGARFDCTDGDRLPMTIQGSSSLSPITYELPVASAQVKSAILLAGLTASGPTTVIENKPTRDHTENMLGHFGVKIDTAKNEHGQDVITIHPTDKLNPCDITVPADPSSAAFPAVAALLVNGSHITMKNIGMNPRRNGIFTTLIEMGADITLSNERDIAGEPVADLTIKGGNPLQGIVVPEDRVPSMIDEFPILAVAASFASGTTYMTGLEELRVKESDRLHMMAKGLADCGVKLEEGEDSLTIYSTDTPPQGGVTVETELDHRIAMSFLILGMGTKEPVIIDDAAPILTSFPNFITLMNTLGAKFSENQQN